VPECGTVLRRERADAGVPGSEASRFSGSPRRHLLARRASEGGGDGQALHQTGRARYRGAAEELGPLGARRPSRGGQFHHARGRLGCAPRLVGGARLAKIDLRGPGIGHGRQSSPSSQRG
jgi:hypothetical protein